MASEKYNFVIVGGGIAGLVLAARLSEIEQNKILVVEAGNDLTEDNRVMTPGLWSSLIATDADWQFKTVPQEGLRGRTNDYPQGRTIGGSGAVNGAAFIAPSKAGIDAWEELGNPGWNWEELSRYFKKVFTLTLPPPDVAKHLGLDIVGEDSLSARGPIQLSYPHDPVQGNVWPRAWLDTWAEKGLDMKRDPWSGQAYGAYITTESIDAKKKQRSHAANTYFAEARKRSNVSVVTGALVEKVLVDNSKPDDAVATGVQYTKDGKIHTVEANEVILAAGAINSPRILELSGIGGASLLQKHSIPVIVDNPNVGENLQNHPVVSTSVEVADHVETLDDMVRQDPAALKAVTEAYTKQLGPLANGALYSAAMLPYPNNEREDVRQELEQLLSSPVTNPPPPASANAAYEAAHLDFVHRVLLSRDTPAGVYFTFPGYAIPALDDSSAGTPDGKFLTLMQFLSYPLSRGSTHIASSSATGPVSVDPKYFSHPLDIEVLARQLIHYIKTITAPTSAIGKLLKPNGKRNPGAEKVEESLEAAKEYVRKSAFGAYHTTGTCAMMAREKGGVVDDSLRVYGVRGLRVCDASVVPITMQANSQALVYAVAEKGADVIKAGA